MLLGVTGIEDHLSEGVPDTIEQLRTAGISVWVITGDKKVSSENLYNIRPCIDRKRP